MSSAVYIGNTLVGDDGDPLEPQFYNGIPARDLTATDYAALSPSDQLLVQNGLLYTFTP